MFVWHDYWAPLKVVQGANSLRKHKIIDSILILSIFFIAGMLRVPACYESFWVDELHTTWCIWDSLDDVAPRAAMGNQSPLYFWGIWLWKLIFGETEIALRMSSVVATSLTAALCAQTILSRTGSIIASLVCGLVLALESNAIFYGTELRPYAWVMLATSIWLALDNSEMKRRVPLQGLVALIAIACQPTAIIAFGLLSFASLMRLNDKRHWMGLATICCLGAACVLFSKTWHQRDMWSSFAKIGSWQDILAIWEWPWLVLGPSAIAISLGWPHRNRLETKKAFRYFAVVITMTLVVALASAWDWVHLWHRRYMIAALPLMATATGIAVAQICDRSFSFYSGRFQISRTIIGLGLVFGLTHWQGTLQIVNESLRNGRPWVLTGRGEDWRSAAAWIRANAPQDDVIGVDSGLIEAERYLGPRGTLAKLPAEVSDYLCYPVLSCYRVDHPVRPGRIADHTLVPARTFVARYSKAATSSVASKDETVLAFGNLSVLQKPAPRPTTTP